jgi:hypothetical protein
MTKKVKTEPEAEVLDEFDDVTEEVTEEVDADEADAEEEVKPAVKPKAKPKAKAKKADKGTLVTYIGKGETPPNRINFMGRQEFVRGHAVNVTDPIVLAKVVTHPCFMEGKVDPAVLAEADEAAGAEADAQRSDDKKVNAIFKKRHG